MWVEIDGKLLGCKGKKVECFYIDCWNALTWTRPIALSSIGVLP